MKNEQREETQKMQREQRKFKQHFLHLGNRL